jgi:hypothetical protein
MPGAAVKHISTAVWAPPGFLQWHEVALQLPKCTQCTAPQHQQQAQQCVQGTYCGGWRRCACLDAKTRVLAVGVLVSTTYNNLTADLLPTCEVPCAWPAPALAGWYCYLGVLPLGPRSRSQEPEPGGGAGGEGAGVRPWLLFKNKCDVATSYVIYWGFGSHRALAPHLGPAAEL